MKHYKNIFLIFLLLTANSTRCAKEVDNLFTSMKYGPWAGITAISAIAYLADYFTVQAKIDRNEKIAENFSIIEQAILLLGADASQETIESIDQQLKQFEQETGHSADMFINEYEAMKNCWNDMYTNYANQSDKEIKAQQLEKVKLSLLELDLAWHTKLNRTYQSKGSIRVYAVVYTALCAAAGLVWYQEC